MRKRITYANVAATMALVFSMSGGALAAKHYLVSSTKQISPTVLKKLKGSAGKTGATGATGATGSAGTPGTPGAPGAKGEIGKEGAAGPFPTTLPAGKTLTGGVGVGRPWERDRRTNRPLVPVPACAASDRSHRRSRRSGPQRLHG